MDTPLSIVIFIGLDIE